MAAEGPRRSTRARKPVKSYAVEQAEAEHEDDETAPSTSKRKRPNAADEDYDGDEDDAPVALPKKKANGKSKAIKKEDDEDTAPVISGWRKEGLSIFVDDPNATKKSKKPGRADTSWHAGAAERRIIINSKAITKLAPGQQETRVRPHVSQPSDAYHKALDKAISQRMFVLDRERSTEEDCHAHHPDCPCETLDMAGSSGNVYTVRISHMPSCTCPVTSFTRKGQETLCKHILYVLHNVLKVPEHLMRQNAFLTTELREIFDNAPALPARVVEMVEEEFDGKRKPVEDDCPICCDEFEDESAEAVVWCRAACGNNVHKKCFDRWAKAKAGNVTCPFCRTPWEFETTKPQKVKVGKVDMRGVKTGAGGYRNVRDQLAYDD